MRKLKQIKNVNQGFQLPLYPLCHGFVVVSNDWSISHYLGRSEKNFLDDSCTNDKNESRKQDNDDQSVCSAQHRLLAGFLGGRLGWFYKKNILMFLSNFYCCVAY